MKKILFLLIICFSMVCYGQNNTTKISSKSSLDKVKEYKSDEFKIKIHKELLVENPQYTDARTAEDSAFYKEKKIPVSINYLRLDAEKIATLYPEVITIDAETNKNIDYLSFVPILLEALNDQQKFIEKLESRINKLESSK